MPARSTIAELPEELRDAVDRAIREGRSTIDELVAMVNAAGHEVSRSAMGRHRKTVAERIAEFRKSQEIASLWIKQARENPDGDVGQVVSELVKLRAFELMQEVGERPEDEEEGINPKLLHLMARTAKDLALGDRHRQQMRAALEAEMRRRFDEAAEREGKGRPDVRAALLRIRSEVYGLTA